MRRIVFKGPYVAAIETADMRTWPGTRSVFVRSDVSLVSPGTELALYTGTHIGFKDPEITWARYPIYPGYATIGAVETLGAGVGDALKVGDRVLHYKPHAELVEIDLDKDLWFPIPTGLRVERALFARFAQIARTAVEAAKGEGAVLVLGAGIIGNLAGQLFRELRGGDVLMADPSAERRALAARCGLARVIDNSQRPLSEAIAEMTSGLGVAIAVEATGIPSLVTDALQAVNRLGEVVLLGSARGKVDLDVYKLVHRKATSLVGAHEGRYPARDLPGRPSQAAFASEALEMIGSGALIVEPFVTDRICPEDLPSMYDALIRDGGQHVGVIVEWRR